MTDSPQPKEPLVQFPCDYPIKIIGNNTEAFLQAVQSVLQTHFPHLETSRIRHSKSANAKFLSVSVTLHLNHEEELHEAYQALKAVPGLQMVL